MMLATCISIPHLAAFRRLEPPWYSSISTKTSPYLEDLPIVFRANRILGSKPCLRLQWLGFEKLPTQLLVDVVQTKPRPALPPYPYSLFPWRFAACNSRRCLHNLTLSFAISYSSGFHTGDSSAKCQCDISSRFVPAMS